MSKHIVESQYYSKSFNGAIFDGPIRIYFAQYQEQTGLKLHHHLNNEFKLFFNQIKEFNKVLKREVYFFIYPNESEMLKYQPPCKPNKVYITPYQDSYVIGFTNENFVLDPLILKSYLDFVCQNWQGVEFGKKERSINIQ